MTSKKQARKGKPADAEKGKPIGKRPANLAQGVRDDSQSLASMIMSPQRAFVDAAARSKSPLMPYLVNALIIVSAIGFVWTLYDIMRTLRSELQKL